MKLGELKICKDMLVLAYDKKLRSKTRAFCKLFSIIDLKNKIYNKLDAKNIKDQWFEVKIYNSTIIKAENGLIRFYENQIKKIGS